MVLEGKSCRLRPFDLDDAEALPPIAGSVLIARNMTSRFAHPYSVDDARGFLESISDNFAEGQVFCIEVDGQVAGCVGARPVTELIHSHILTCGYWLGVPFWGQGIATEAVGLFVCHLFRTFPVQRLDAYVFAWNPASARVLEKNGFVLEGRRRLAVQKFGEFTDELGFGLLRIDWEARL